jgi:hypothetical protein
MWQAIRCVLSIVVCLECATTEMAAESMSLTAEIRKAILDYPEIPVPLERLRAAGPAALDELFQLRGDLELATSDERDPGRSADLRHQIDRLNSIIDLVGRQRYCSRSRLYWYTDFEQAKEAAQSSGKPILSLRMLGRLDEDFSCANSRFFRTTLYANAEISQLLRENFVLHWQSVRPVPKVTIDFGDGRKLERTLTGNSIHYMLTPDGDVVEALPGLYGPKAFLRNISAGLELARRVAALPPAERQNALAAHHATEFVRINESWESDLARVRLAPPSLAAVSQPRLAPNSGAPQPPANAAVVIARPKGGVEWPLVRAALPLATSPANLEDDRIWEAIAALHAEDAAIDDASRELIRSQNPTAARAGLVAITKRKVEDPLLQMVRTFESSIAVDTVKNEYRLHRQIHQWLLDASYRPGIAELNERVYAELFLTPSSDPWLGLAPADIYTALPNGGVVPSAK